MPLPDLDVLVAVLDAGSLTAAAERLGVPRATVSRWLSRLEQQLGSKLIHRTTRKLAPTNAGIELYRHARAIVDAIDVATTAVRVQDDIPRGILRVSMPPGGDDNFGTMLAAFLQSHPLVHMEVVCTTRHVDLIAEGFDVAVRAGSGTQPSLIQRTLVKTPFLAVASPAYIQQHGSPLPSGPRRACLPGELQPRRDPKATLAATGWQLHSRSNPPGLQRSSHLATVRHRRPGHHPAPDELRR